MAILQPPRAEMVKQKAHIVLCDAGITSKTRNRHFIAVRRLLPVLEKSRNPTEMDSNVSDWIQQRWEQGDSLHQVSDALCAVHHWEPWTRRRKGFAAPPLAQRILDAMVMYCVCHCSLELAAVLVLGFYALLRTGECLQVRP